MEVYGVGAKKSLDHAEAKCDNIRSIDDLFQKVVTCPEK